ncbi:carbohydrate kinase family protein [Zongyangia hominis]|uniref:Carbohydrate kinase family protein n=1 Tax=Zongyangia hominis TaxID=2763677 RepID=A0A926EDW4_9FIRM|nr:carbohydrate kinase family protein [Zongyangia hominis]MBC8570399.1 carbohydrate kinase family protein [Zongyangia hominis]
MALDIVTIGLACSDVALKPMVRELFERDAIHLDSIQSQSGGDAVNCAIDCQKMGLNAGVVCKVGTDMFASPILDNLKDAGVDTQGVIVDPNVRTSVSIVCIEPSGERHFAVTMDANNSLCYEDVDVDFVKNSGAKVIQYGSAVSCPNMDLGIGKLFAECQEAGMLTSCDMSCCEDMDEELKKLDGMFHHLDIYLPSMYEVTALTGKETCEEIEEFFRPYGIKMMAIKLGGDGCFVTDFKKHRYIRTFENAPVVDTTGCGDSFCAGFLTAIIKGWDIEEAAVYGNAVGSCNCQVIGANLGVRSFEDTMAFIKENIEYVPEDLRARFQ